MEELGYGTRPSQSSSIPLGSFAKYGCRKLATLQQPGRRLRLALRGTAAIVDPI